MTPTTVSHCITTLRRHSWLMTHCGYHDCQGDAIWQLLVLKIFLLFLDHVSQCLSASYYLHCRAFCSGQGINWSPCLCSFVKSHLSLVKSLKLRRRMETLEILLMIVVGGFFSQVCQRADLSISVYWFSKLFFGRKPLIEVRKFPMKTVYTMFESLQWFTG